MIEKFLHGRISKVSVLQGEGYFMKNLDESEHINSSQIIKVLSKTLKVMDKRLMEHGERVTYIVYQIYKQGKLEKEFDWKKLFLLSSFHDIGAYKTEEIDKMLQFETVNMKNHAAYGYCFLKNMSPLGDYAQAILYHHTPYEQLTEIDEKYKEYASIIFFADRVDTLIQNRKNLTPQQYYDALNNGMFSKRYLDIFKQINKNNEIRDDILTGKFMPCVEGIVYSDHFISQEEALEYLKKLVYSIDFRSEYTVTHTINTIAISIYIGRKMKLCESDLDKLYLGALLHDLGKICIPLEILESPNKLTDSEMSVMRTHVEKTQEIIEGLVSDEICKIAVRHHEKLDGSGYPYGLKENQLSVMERIIAVADIMSALTSTRSYKRAFPREKTISIIKDMKNTKKLDETVCDIVIADFDDIVYQTDTSRDAIVAMYKNVSTEFVRLTV